MGTFGAAVALHGLLAIGILMAGLIVFYLLQGPDDPTGGT